MRTLFWRIFLWMWIAMVGLGAILIVSSPFFTRTRPRLERWQQASEATLLGWAAEAARTIAQSGVAGLAPPPHAGRREGLLQIYAIDGAGRDAHGRAVPREVADLATKVLESGEEQVARSATIHLAARVATAPEGTRLAVVAAMRRPPRMIDLLEPGALLPRLAVLMALLALLALGLAGHLARPIGAVRAAARRLAGGDLTARVGRPVAARRDEIGQLARDLDGMAERLEALVDAQRRLVRDVSHELRSPLARLAMATELARQQSGPEAEEALDRIERDLGRLDELVSQLLALSRLEAGVEMEHAPVDLSALLADVAADATIEARPRSCEVTVDAPDALIVPGSARLLRSAVENVIRNAVRFTAPGSAVELSLAVDGGSGARRALIRVADHGPGVPPDTLAHLFEPFFRAEAARERSPGGAGLGLAIAARAVQLHGGTIAAANGPSGGLVVEIGLPLPA